MLYHRTGYSHPHICLTFNYIVSNITCLRHEQITPISTETRMTYCVHRKILVIGNSESQLAILLAKMSLLDFSG